MFTVLAKFWEDDQGQTILEYILLALGIIMLVSAAVFLFGRYLAAAFRVLQCAVREIVEAGDVPGCADQFDPGG